MMKVYDEMGDSNYVGMIEIDINEINEYVEVEIPQMNHRMANQQIVVQFFKLRNNSDNVVNMNINYQQMQ